MRAQGVDRSCYRRSNAGVCGSRLPYIHHLSLGAVSRLVERRTRYELHCLSASGGWRGSASATDARARREARAGSGQDDFAGLRSYQPGDSLKHVAWKAAARGQPVMTKQFTGLEAGQLWLAWSDSAG